MNAHARQQAPPPTVADSVKDKVTPESEEHPAQHKDAIRRQPNISGSVGFEMERLLEWVKERQYELVEPPADHVLDHLVSAAWYVLYAPVGPEGEAGDERAWRARDAFNWMARVRMRWSKLLRFDFPPTLILVGNASSFACAPFWRVGAIMFDIAKLPPPPSRHSTSNWEDFARRVRVESVPPVDTNRLSPANVPTHGLDHGVESPNSPTMYPPSQY